MNTVAYLMIFSVVVAYVCGAIGGICILKIFETIKK